MTERIRDYDEVLRVYYAAMGSAQMAEQRLCGRFTRDQITKRARCLGLRLDPAAALERKRASVARALLAFQAKAEARREAPSPPPVPKVRKGRKSTEPLLTVARCPSIFALAGLMGVA